LAQGREGRAGSARCWGRRGSSLLGDTETSSSPGQINTLCSLRSGRHLHHSAASFDFLWGPERPCSMEERRDVRTSLHLCIHKQNPRTRNARPPPPHNPMPQSWVPLPSVTHRSVGTCQALGLTADADAADLGRRILPAASAALRACSRFRRPGEGCVGVLLARDMIPSFCLSLPLSPAPAKAQLSAPWARSRGSFCLPLCNLYVRDLAACPGPYSPGSLEALASVQAPASRTHWSKGIFPAVTGMQGDSCHVPP